MAAGVRAAWMAAPDAAAIRAADRARLAGEEALYAAATDEEAAEAVALLEARGARALAVALLRLHRARLPAPVALSTPERERERAAPGSTQWFRLNVGRHKNADPRWLLPLLCRLGGVSRKDIGAIRIHDRETRFEVIGSAAEGFVAALAEAEMGEMRISPCEADRPQRPEGATPREAAREAPRGPARRFHPGARPAGKPKRARAG